MEKCTVKVVNCHFFGVLERVVAILGASKISRSLNGPWNSNENGG